MADWTETEVVQALESVKADWEHGPGTEWYTVKGALRLEVQFFWDGWSVRWLDTMRAQTGRKLVVSTSDWNGSPDVHFVSRALCALRTIVVATYGEQAWPWEMIEGSIHDTQA